MISSRPRSPAGSPDSAHTTAARTIPDSRPGHYYVSVYRCNNNAGIGAETPLLRGPFINDHAGALSAVDESKRRAIALDKRAEWYAYGTRRADDDLGPGILDQFEARTGEPRGTSS